MAVRILSYGGKTVWMLILGFIAAAVLSVMLLTRTAELRYQRDVNRMVYNDNLGVLNEVKAKLGMTGDSLKSLLSESPAAAANQPYIVVSMADHRLWYKQGKEVLYEAPVATGSGKELVGGSAGQWRFETPRGRLTVKAKDEDPAWVPPDWHYVEQAHKKGLGIVHLAPGQTISTGDGVITTQNGEVVKRYSNGSTVSLGGGVEGKEIVANGNIVVPPYGTTARRYAGVLGTRRLELGDGYGIHGTDHPETIGQSVSHGCVRMRNEDIEKLYPMVQVGTPVYIY
ncbi:MAG TPA: L,D-transpeptidase [Gemmatimonadaceae bacterium]|jgi:lipoprotein-anchoring transpeptidase ErfK/SrfK|nr:L,D-transpeptidase [Gemmatimonadaceae bacterium]